VSLIERKYYVFREKDIAEFPSVPTRNWFHLKYIPNQTILASANVKMCDMYYNIFIMYDVGRIYSDHDEIKVLSE
jgi:predicted RNA-binding protein associated with RNAse of E/G family